MSDLPLELVEEIFSRVPAKALSRFRSTCKRWNALFKDKRFTKKHNDRAAKQFLALILNKRRVSSLSLNFDGTDHNNIAAPFTELKGELALKDSCSSSSEQVDILQAFHCDGLLLCNTVNNRLLVWNPCTGETRFIIPTNHYSTYSMFALGYEHNNSSCRNYKILRYGNYSNSVAEFEIYEFSTGSWRILNLIAKLKKETRGVSLKGNTYWITYDDYILCFNFSTERLRLMPLPFEGSDSYTTAITTFGDDQLSVLHQNRGMSKLEIWVTINRKVDHTIVLAWSKLFAIDLYSLFSDSRLLFFPSFFIDEQKKVVVCCDWSRIDKTNKNTVCVFGEKGVYREIHLGESIQKLEGEIIFNYVPSLVQIQQGV